jgi:hypothetical protein
LLVSLSATLTAFPFRGRKARLRFQERRLLASLVKKRATRITPRGQEDLQMWSDMVTIANPASSRG